MFSLGPVLAAFMLFPMNDEAIAAVLGCIDYLHFSVSASGGGELI